MREDCAIAESSADSDGNQVGLASLVGCLVKDCVVDSKTHHVIFACSGGLQISLRANLEEYDEDDQILVMALTDAYISYRPKLGFVANLRSPATTHDKAEDV